MPKAKYAIIVHLPGIENIPLCSSQYSSEEDVYGDAKKIKKIVPILKVDVERIDDNGHNYDEITAAD